jgi:hypothetical protein
MTSSPQSLSPSFDRLRTVSEVEPKVWRWGKRGEVKKQRRCTMLKPLKIVLGVVLLLSCVGLASQILSEAEVFAQTADTAWVRRYDGPADGSDVAEGIAVDDSGYVYVTGYSEDDETYYDYATIKYHPNGDTVWVRRYDGPGNSDDEARAIAVDDSGNVYVTGVSVGSGTSGDYATIKYQPDGDTAWIRRYTGAGNGNDEAEAIAVDGSGSVYVTGGGLAGVSSRDYITIKYHPNGDTAWVRVYDAPGNATDEANAMAVDGSGNVYITGRSEAGGTLNDYATIKYLSNGDTAWVRRYNGPGNGDDKAKALVVDGSGNSYVIGQSEGSGSSDDYATIKYYPNGDTAWVRRYNGPANGSDGAEGIAVDDSGNVYVTGYSDSTGSSQDYATIKYDSSGNELWVKRYNCANGTDMPYAIAVDGSNNVYVTGYSGCGGVTGFDYVTIKYYPTGDTAWLRKYHGPVENGDDDAYALAVDNSGNVYVTGMSQGSGTDYDYCTIKYTKTTGVEDETGDKEKPTEFALSQNYPNPFNPTTAIRFKVEGQRLKVPVPTTLKIYNVLGEEVRTLVNEKKFPGDHTVQWDGKNDKGEQLASGVYFYELKVGEYTSAKKMVLLK